MGFGKKPPKPKPPANAPIIAADVPFDLPETPFGVGSLITTSPAGLRRKPNTLRTSLIGG